MKDLKSLVCGFFVVENIIILVIFVGCVFAYYFTDFFNPKIEYVYVEKPVTVEKLVEVEKPVFVNQPTPLPTPTPTPAVQTLAKKAATPKPTPFVETECKGGVVNGKVINLVKPNYPEDAKPKNLNAKVSVAVVIGEDGKVISAKGDSKYDFFNKAAEEAALASTYSQTLLDCKPVKVSGVIVYGFKAK